MGKIQFCKSLITVSTLLLMSVGAQRLYSQAATASITGTIFDSSGAVIPGANINAKNTGTGISRTTVTDNQGRYNLPDLAIGSYDVQATKTGFQTLIKKELF